LFNRAGLPILDSLAAVVLAGMSVPGGAKRGRSMSLQNWLGVMLLVTAALLAGGCASRPERTIGPRASGLAHAPAGLLHRRSPETSRTGMLLPAHPGRRAGPGFEFFYLPASSSGLAPIQARVRELDLIRSLPEIQALDGVFALPRPLRYVTGECGELGAFYEPSRGEVVICYELLETLYQRGLREQTEQRLQADYAVRYTRANVRFVVLHETGHALVDLLDLPVTGRQEDAVDQLAAMLMLHFSSSEETPDQVMGNLRMAADWLLSHATGAYNLDAYADEHTLGEQRYFNLQCLIYGTDPIGYAGIVEQGDLPLARAQRCPGEARMAGLAWLRLLLPHVSPRYRMSESDAVDYFRRPR